MKQPPIHRRLIMWIVECWRLVMDNRFNPLKYIPDPSLQAYFTLVLFTMWSAYFGFVAIFYMGWLGYDIMTSVIVHLTVLIPVVFTNAVFRDAERDGAKWYLHLKEQERIRKLFTSKKNIVKWDIDKEA